MKVCTITTSIIWKMKGCKCLSQYRWEYCISGKKIVQTVAFRYVPMPIFSSDNDDMGIPGTSSTRVLTVNVSWQLIVIIIYEECDVQNALSFIVNKVWNLPPVRYTRHAVLRFQFMHSCNFREVYVGFVLNSVWDMTYDTPISWWSDGVHRTLKRGV